MDLKAFLAVFLLALPVVLPPYLQYQYEISATLTLTVIIIFYLPIWYKFRKEQRWHFLDAKLFKSRLTILRWWKPNNETWPVSDLRRPC